MPFTNQYKYSNPDSYFQCTTHEWLRCRFVDFHLLSCLIEYMINLEWLIGFGYEQLASHSEDLETYDQQLRLYNQSQEQSHHRFFAQDSYHISHLRPQASVESELQPKLDFQNHHHQLRLPRSSWQDSLIESKKLAARRTKNRAEANWRLSSCTQRIVR